MKHFFIIFLILCFLSCKKDSDNNGLKANIRYNIANTNISSVSFFSSFGDCPSIPSPKDSTVNMNFSINNDSINNFIFKANHFQCGNTHCLFFTYSINMSSINKYDSIRVDKHNNAIPEILDSTVDISKNGLWKNAVQLLLNSPCPLPFETSFEDSYIGIKINNNYGWIHISPFGCNGVEILDYAINLTENSTIKPGQKK